MKKKLARLRNAIVENWVNPVLVRNKVKIFCVGANKTGTTSLQKEFINLGFKVGNQRNAERLLRSYLNKDYDAIINSCHSAQVFQDFPFCMPETFIKMDKAFPGSKFILSIRDSSDQWYKSLTQFHARRFGNGNIPNKFILQNTIYNWKGYLWEVHKGIFKPPDDDIYNVDVLTEFYENHNRSVIEYFKDRPNDLLVINLSDPGSYQRFLNFLDLKSKKVDFPWENKTSKLKIS